MITKELYPRTYQLLNDWLSSKVNTLGANLPVKITDVVTPEVLVDTVIKTNGGILYEAFDDYNLYPSVRKSEMGWKWRIEGSFPMEGNAGSRKEAESKAFEECAKRLEKL